jgi:hypothetical protein
MHTESGRRMAARRTAVLRRYLQDLEAEIGANGSNSNINDIHNSCNNTEIY